MLHLIRNTFRYASRKYWEQISKDLRPVYTAPTEAAAGERFAEFAETWGERYPAIRALCATPGRNSSRSWTTTSQKSRGH